MTKDEIIAVIQETARANGGTPLGRTRLLKETGIAEHHYQKFGTLGQLQEEAGFTPNALNESMAEDELVDQLITLCCRYGQFPTNQQLRQARHESPDEFASHNTYTRLGASKADRAATIVAALSSKDVLTTDERLALDICLPLAEDAENKTSDPEGKMNICGYVYLFRDGKAYKIGNSTDPDARRDALQTGNPRRIVLVHRIVTDDPPGIEAYWHNRFRHRNANIAGGDEWFFLSKEDVAAIRSRVRM